MTSSPPPGEGDRTRPVWRTQEFWLGAMTYSTYLIGSVSEAVRGLTFIPLLAFALFVVLQPDRFRVRPPLLLFCLAFLTCYLASYLLNERTPYGTFKVTILWLKFVPLLLIPAFVRDRHRAFFAGVFVVLIAFLGLASLKSVAQLGAVSINARVEFGIFNPIWIARAALECMLIALVVLRLPRRWTAFLLASTLLVTFVAGSKGPLVAFLVALAAWRLGGRAGPKAWRVAAVLGVVVAFSVGVALLASRLDAESYLVQRFLRAVPESSSEDVILESRPVVWPLTLARLAAESPARVLVGHGVGNFGTFYFGQYYPERTYPHNLLLELLVEQGALMALAVAGFVVWLLLRYRTDLRVLLIYCLVNAMFSGDLPLNEYIFFYLGWVAVLGHTGRATQASSGTSPVRRRRVGAFGFRAST